MWSMHLHYVDFKTPKTGGHMAIHMAMGLLFLGGGMYTLSNSSEAVAALLCAFFPTFPCNMADNKLHSQGMLAVSRTSMITA
jgi:anaphase-promoting complex subunit 1